MLGQTELLHIGIRLINLNPQSKASFRVIIQIWVEFCSRRLQPAYIFRKLKFAATIILGHQLA